MVLVKGVSSVEGFAGPSWMSTCAYSSKLLEFSGTQIKRKLIVEDNTWRESSGKGGWNGAVRGVVRMQMDADSRQPLTIDSF